MASTRREFLQLLAVLPQSMPSYCVNSLLDAAQQGEAIATTTDVYGQRFMIEWTVGGPTGEADIRTAWIVRYDEDFPRFVSCYVC